MLQLGKLSKKLVVKEAWLLNDKGDKIMKLNIEGHVIVPKEEVKGNAKRWR